MRTYLCRTHREEKKRAKKSRTYTSRCTLVSHFANKYLLETGTTCRYEQVGGIVLRIVCNSPIEKSYKIYRRSWKLQDYVRPNVIMRSWTFCKIRSRFYARLRIGNRSILSENRIYLDFSRIHVWLSTYRWIQLRFRVLVIRTTRVGSPCIWREIANSSSLITKRRDYTSSRIQVQY